MEFPLILNTLKHFDWKDDQLTVENVAVHELAMRFGTPLYVYSRQTLEDNWRLFDQALAGQDHQICYAVKANSNLAVLNCLAQLGSGFDIVSQGELMRVLRAGGDPEKVVFSGVGKLSQEMEYALQVGIGCFNIESPSELMRLNDVANRIKKIAPIAIRVNPNIDAGTHHYIATGLKENKFGVDLDEVLDLYQIAASLPYVHIVGIACHIGSQLMDLKPFLAATNCVLDLYKTLKAQGIQIKQLDLGGGLGVVYRNEQPPSILDYGKQLLEQINDKSVKILIEPGRAISANAGILVTRVEYLKHTGHKNFAIVDAAMNDLLRPALYGAEQEIVQVSTQFKDLVGQCYDIVGPVCETGDFLAKDRTLAIRPGDLLAILSTGAYGFSMSSNYNTRPRAAEVMVHEKQAYLVRQRETVEELLAKESIIQGNYLKSIHID